MVQVFKASYSDLNFSIFPYVLVYDDCMHDCKTAVNLRQTKLIFFGVKNGLL